MPAPLPLRAFEVSFDFLERLAFGFRQEPGGGDEVNHGAAGESEERGRGAIAADGGQEDRGDRSRDGLIEHEGDTHAVGADARGHQLRERQPYAYTGTDGVERDRKSTRLNSSH